MKLKTDDELFLANLKTFKNFTPGDKLLLEYETESKFSGKASDFAILEKFSYDSNSNLVLGVRVVTNRDKMIDFLWIDPQKHSVEVINLSRAQE